MLVIIFWRKKGKVLVFVKVVEWGVRSRGERIVFFIFIGVVYMGEYGYFYLLKENVLFFDEKEIYDYIE